jgi:hypothetical protein
MPRPAPSQATRRGKARGCRGVKVEEPASAAPEEARDAALQRALEALPAVGRETHGVGDGKGAVVVLPLKVYHRGGLVHHQRGRVSTVAVQVGGR